MSLQPRVGCGAFIQDSEGRLLLVKRRRDPEADHWGLPGGKLDFGETVKACIAREILEELGIEIKVGALLCVVDQIAAESHWVAPTHRASITNGAPSIQEPLALADWGWFALDQLPVPLTLATRTALAALESL